MSRQKTHHTKQFKLDAINYRKEHPDLTQVECAKNLGNCLRGYLLCQQLSWQNFSFYFVLNLDTGPFTISVAYKFHTFLFFGLPQLLTLSLFSLQFEGIYIQQELIKSEMKYSVLVRPRLH